MFWELFSISLKCWSCVWSLKWKCSICSISLKESCAHMLSLLMCLMNWDMHSRLMNLCRFLLMTMMTTWMSTCIDSYDDDDDDDDNDIHAGSSSMVSLSFAATPVEPGGPISISIKTIIISDLVNFIKIIVDPKILWICLQLGHWLWILSQWSIATKEFEHKVFEGRGGGRGVLSGYLGGYWVNQGSATEGWFDYVSPACCLMSTVRPRNRHFHKNHHIHTLALGRDENLNVNCLSLHIKLCWATELLWTISSKFIWLFQLIWRTWKDEEVVISKFGQFFKVHLVPIKTIIGFIDNT